MPKSTRPTAKSASKRVLAVSALLAAACAWQPAFAVNAETAPPASAASDEIQNLLVSKGILAKIGDQIVQKGEAISERTSDLVSTAIGFLGIPYLRGGNSAETGFDCSGFVRAIYKDTIGLILPRSADQQAHATQKIDKSELKPGDLVFFNTLKRTFSHVGIYMGDNKFIHSPRTGASVRIEDMRIPYWNVRFDGARRVGNRADATASSVTSTVATPSSTFVAE
jgi:cell wall-associated NlpC family hydrolase